MEKKNLKAILASTVEVPKSYVRYLNCPVILQRNNQIVVQTSRGSQITFSVEGNVIKKLKQAGFSDEPDSQSELPVVPEVEISKLAAKAAPKPMEEMFWEGTEKVIAPEINLSEPPTGRLVLMENQMLALDERLNFLEKQVLEQPPAQQDREDELAVYVSRLQNLEERIQKPHESPKLQQLEERLRQLANLTGRIETLEARSREWQTTAAKWESMTAKLQQAEMVGRQLGETMSRLQSLERKLESDAASSRMQSLEHRLEQLDIAVQCLSAQPEPVQTSAWTAVGTFLRWVLAKFVVLFRSLARLLKLLGQGVAWLWRLVMRSQPGQYITPRRTGMAAIVVLIAIVAWKYPWQRNDNGNEIGGLSSNLATDTPINQQDSGIVPSRTPRKHLWKQDDAPRNANKPHRSEKNGKWDAAEYEQVVEQNLAIAELLQQTKDPVVEERRKAVKALQELTRNSLTEVQRRNLASHLAKFLHDEDDIICVTAVRGVGDLNYREAVDDLVQLVRHPGKPFGIREAALHAALQAMGNRADSSVTAKLWEVFKDSRVEVDLRAEVAGALGKLGDPKVCRDLVNALASPEPIIQAAAARALGHFGYPYAVPGLIELLGAKYEIAVRISAAEALGNMETSASDCAQALIDLWSDSATPSELRTPVKESLQKLTSKVSAELRQKIQGLWN